MYMDMSRAIFRLALMQLLLTACRLPAAPLDEQASGASAIGPIPYATLTTPPTTSTAPSAGEQSLEGQPLSDAEQLRLGETIYATHCAPCHQPNGEGNLETFPPLNRNAFVTLRAPGPVIDTVLHGRELMPAFAPTLDDAEVAAVLSYIRNSWNNNASFVNAEQVGEIHTRASEE
jgi:mono/diheme cytochrome c family protein